MPPAASWSRVTKTSGSTQGGARQWKSSPEPILARGMLRSSRQRNGYWRRQTVQVHLPAKRLEPRNAVADEPLKKLSPQPEVLEPVLIPKQTLAPSPAEHLFGYDKEAARAYERVHFTKTDWIQHRSSGRYWRHLLAPDAWHSLRSLVGPILCTMALSAVAASLHTWRVVPTYIAHNFNASPMACVLVTSMISLLLAFRANNCYARWHSARASWGVMITRIRNVVRQNKRWVHDRVSQQHIHSYMMCFGYCLMHRLREEPYDRVELLQHVSEAEVEKICNVAHAPMYCLQAITALVRRQHLTPMQEVRMDENLSLISDCIGECENILRNPVPVLYTRHMSRSVMLYLLILPFALVQSCGWSATLFSGLIAATILGIDEAAVNVEEPFTILPLELLCAEIEKSCDSMDSADVDAPPGAPVVRRKEASSVGHMLPGWTVFSNSTLFGH
eukprot:scaffold7242_cov400-Prasinococcus_capsulatus_cf.AAC.23